MSDTRLTLLDRLLRLERAVTELRQGGQYDLAGAMPDWHLYPACDEITSETLERFDPRDAVPTQGPASALFRTEHG